MKRVRPAIHAELADFISEEGMEANAEPEVDVSGRQSRPAHHDDELDQEEEELRDFPEDETVEMGARPDIETSERGLVLGKLVEGDQPDGPEVVDHQAMIAEAARVMNLQLKRSIQLPWQEDKKLRRLGTESIAERLRCQVGLHEIGALDIQQLEGGDPLDEIGLVEKQSPFILRRLCRARISKSDSDVRNLALKKIKSILLLDLEATALGRSLTAQASKLASEGDLGMSIQDAFRAKATATLQKRASALTRFFSWVIQHDTRSPLRFTEEMLYGYLCHLRTTKAGATSLLGTLEALRFFHAIVSLPFDLEMVISSRCRGAARDMQLTKMPLEQKEHLSANALIMLEELMQTERSLVKKSILGQILFCVHACCRWQDAIRMKSVEITSHGPVLVVEGRATESKTSAARDMQVRLIPYVALGEGLAGRDWATPWLKAREAQKWGLAEGFLPSWSERLHAWAEVSMTASEGTVWLQEFLLDTDLETEETVQRFGTHSLKTTLLTMASRCPMVNFSRSERLLLGHHLDPQDKSMVTYSREAYTTLYGKVLRMFQMQRDGSWDPDATPGERIAEVASALAGHEEGRKQPEVDVLESGSSEGGDPEDPLDVPAEPIHAPRPLFGMREDDDCIIHRFSGIAHLADNEGRTLCGRRITERYAPWDQASVTDDPECCIQCGRIVGRR